MSVIFPRRPRKMQIADTAYFFEFFFFLMCVLLNTALSSLLHFRVNIFVSSIAFDHEETSDNLSRTGFEEESSRDVV